MIAPAFSEPVNAASAVSIVRGICPYSAPMATLVRVGSGEMVLLGFADDDDRMPTNAEADILLSLFVRAVPESIKDRNRVSERKHWDPSSWAAPVMRPTATSARVQRVELRQTGRIVPVDIDAQVGRVPNGDQVIFLQIGNEQVSLRFPGTSPGFSGRDTVIHPPSEGHPTNGRHDHDLHGVLDR